MSAEQKLKVVAYRVDWPADFGIAPDRFYGADDAHRMNCHLSYVHGVAAPIVVPLVRLTDAQSALESERQAHAAEVERLRGDAARMDWLMEHTVNVRVHMRYGSRNLFWAGPQEGDGEILPSDLRTRIDQAIARGKT